MMPVFVSLIARIMKPQILPGNAVRKGDSLNVVLGQFIKNKNKLSFEKMFKLLIGTVSVISSAFHLKHWQGFPLFQKKIPFWKWNDTEICSRIPGKFCMKWKIKFFWFTLHNPDFFLFHGMETRDFRNPDFWNVKKKSGFYFQTRKISEIHSTN